MEAADTVASEARRRVALGRPDEWQMFELISLQGLVAHSRGEWFQRLRMELRSGASRPALAAHVDGLLAAWATPATTLRSVRPIVGRISGRKRFKW